MAVGAKLGVSGQSVYNWAHMWRVQGVLDCWSRSDTKADGRRVERRDDRRGRAHGLVRAADARANRPAPRGCIRSAAVRASRYAERGAQARKRDLRSSATASRSKEA
ncbi:hypothetical protein [Burkholderia ubonensis]